jgi:hypothetical protein
LLPSCSRGKLPAVWLCSSSRREYARLHVATRRHHVPVDQVVLVRVLVDRQQLRRSGRRGLWCCLTPIPPSAIVSITLPAARAAAVASV